MAESDGLDNFLAQLGTGRWNYIHFAASAMVPAVLPIYLIGSEFLNPEPSFTCNIPDNNTRPINGTQCHMLEDTGENEVEVPCKSWNYDTSMFHTTIAMEWDLVCDRAWLFPFFQTSYTIGCFIGAIFAGIAANRFGRRWAMRIGALLTIVTTLVLIFAPWLPLVLSARIILGVFNTIMVCPAFMLSMEVCESNLRPTVGILLALPYAIMMIGLAGLAYFIRDWRTLQAAASFPCLLLLPLCFYIDESPRWLVVRGHLQQAVDVLERALKFNRSKLHFDVNDLVNRLYMRQTQPTTVKTWKPTTIDIETCKVCFTSIGSEKSGCLCTATSSLGLDDGFGPWWAGPCALVRTNVMRKITSVLILVFLLQAVVYLGLPLSSSSFSSPFLYMALLGVMELPAYTLTAPITKKLGRKAVVTTSFITAGILLLTTVVLQEVGVHQEWIYLWIVLISYLLVCTAYQVNFLYAPELLPTTLRPWGTSVCSLAAYVGFSVPPIFTDFLGENQQWIAPCVFGLCSFTAGVLVFLLPETNGQSLPETVADLKDLTNKEKLLKKSCTVVPEVAIAVARKISLTKSSESFSSSNQYDNQLYG